MIGPGTDVISGEGKILTAGGFDSHVHFLSPSQITEALAAGLTTLGGGGTGPSEGSKATTVTPGAWHLKQFHRSLDAFPVNLLVLGQGQHRLRGRASRSRRSPVPAATRFTRTGARPRPPSTPR